jgi:SAM-dependent methyltransferase
VQLLNAGAGSSNYDWITDQTVHLDRFLGQLGARPRGVVGDIMRLPFPNEAFFGVACVGSALNYVSALEAISEIARVTTPGGLLLLHFESSRSWEHVGTSRWGKDVALFRTANGELAESIWLYSPEFIVRTLNRYGFSIASRQSFHVASSAMLRLGFSQGFSSRFANADRYLRLLHKFGDDIILVARKQ